MATRTAARRLSALRQFYRFLAAEGRRGDDPSAIIDSPRQGRPLPKLLSYVVPFGYPCEFTAPIGERPELLRVHYTALCWII